MYKGIQRSVCYEWLMLLSAAAGTLTGGMLVQHCPAHAFWQEAAFTLGFGVEDMPLLRLIALGCLPIGIMAAAGLSVLGGAAAAAVVFARGMALGAVLTRLYAGLSGDSILTGVLFAAPYGLGSLLLLLLPAKEVCAAAEWLSGALLGNAADPFPLRRFASRFWLLEGAQAALAAGQYLLLRFGYAAFLQRFS